MLESIDIVGGLLTSAAAGVVTGGGWLVSKLYSLHRHEINNMKQATASNRSTMEKLGEHMLKHFSEDAAIQRVISSDLGEIKGYLKGQAEARERS